MSFKSERKENEHTDVVPIQLSPTLLTYAYLHIPLVSRLEHGELSNFIN
jgi:hypothetical protein